MTPIRHLARADLAQLTRAELFSRAAEESAYWKKRTATEMAEQDLQAYLKFLHIAATLHDPRGLADHLSNVINGHDDDYLDEAPDAAGQAPR
ncbi:hypothetical protein [Streptomyces qinglanensis]|uniref:hypothetical protein n=1 Tax=Streptomyces qinglanensis TaxID=943816 RepID=UPI0037A1F469